MRELRFAVAVVLVCAAAIASNVKSPLTPSRKTAPKRVAVTTASPQARAIFEQAMVSFERFRINETLEFLRAATKKDPAFAQAFILISELTSDPEEQNQAREKAKSLASHVTPGEQLLIHWLGGVQEENYVPAIAAMNDLLAKYPQDPHLLFLAGRWLEYQDRYEQSAMLLEKAVALEPDYPAAVNELGYAYAHLRQFDKALAAMAKYVALQPEEPNPHDSYGEILRMAGKFDEALEQYRMAVRIDPSFGSDLGIADTLALMGKEEEARAQYARGLPFVKTEAERVDREMQSAATWVREYNYKQADHALREVARHAHGDGLAVAEAKAHRLMAMYEPDFRTVVRHLQAAENALNDGHPISKNDHDAEWARILGLRARRAGEAHAMELAASAVAQLQAMAQKSRSQVIQLCYHAGEGALLMARENYAEAIPHLQEDSENPFALRMLWQAYQQTGAQSEAEKVAKRLAALNDPTVEQALIVPAFRASLVSQVEQAPR